MNNQFKNIASIQGYNRKILTKHNAKSTSNMLIKHKNKIDIERIAIPLLNKAKMNFITVNHYEMAKYYQNKSRSKRSLSKDIIPIQEMQVVKYIENTPVIKKVHLPKITSRTQGIKRKEQQFIDSNLKLAKDIKVLQSKQSIPKPIVNKGIGPNDILASNNNSCSLIVKSHFAFTQPGGKHKQLSKNQDSYMEKPTSLSPSSSSKYQYYGVFDGHGKHGSQIANSVSSFLSQYYSQTQFIGESLYDTDTISNELTKDNHLKIKSSYAKASDMLKVNDIDASLSGTSATIVFIIEDMLLCSNVGDSRAIAISMENKVIPLSFDHKPELPSEMERIVKMNGRVERYSTTSRGSCSNNISDPVRVWLKEENYPGLSLSRSIGDFIAQEIGVIDDPDVFQFSLKSIKPKMIICATDGLWELMSYGDIVSILNKYYLLDNIEEGVRKLTTEARNTWIEKNNGFIDDITIIVLFF